MSNSSEHWRLSKTCAIAHRPRLVLVLSPVTVRSLLHAYPEYALTYASVCSMGWYLLSNQDREPQNTLRKQKTIYMKYAAVNSPNHCVVQERHSRI